MKKLLLSFVITAGIVTTIGGVSTFAASGTSSTEPSSVNQSVYNVENKIDKSDPLYISLKEKQTTLNNLNNTEGGVFDSLNAQNQINKDLKDRLISERKSTFKGNKEEIQSQVTVIENSILPLRQQKVDLYRKLSDAVRSKDKESSKSLNEQIKNVNQQINTLEAQIKTLRSSVKDTSSDVKATKAEMKAAIEEIKAFDAALIALHADVLSLRASKATEWISFSNSIKSLNLVAANTNFDNIISLKHQILDKSNQTLTIKKQITAILNSLL